MGEREQRSWNHRMREQHHCGFRGQRQWDRASEGTRCLRRETDRAITVTVRWNKIELRLTLRGGRRERPEKILLLCGEGERREMLSLCGEICVCLLCTCVCVVARTNMTLLYFVFCAKFCALKYHFPKQKFQNGKRIKVKEKLFKIFDKFQKKIWQVSKYY